MIGKDYRQPSGRCWTIAVTGRAAVRESPRAHVRRYQLTGRALPSS